MVSDEEKWRLSLRIAAFPNDNKEWQIDWFGAVRYRNRYVQGSQISVEVHLSRARLFKHKYRNKEDVCTCWVSVGTLVVLRIGDRWRNQRFVGNSKGANEIFPDIDVQPTTWSYVKAGGRHPDTGEYLLPFAEHPEHQNSTKSNCVEVRLSNDKFLMIPCMELIRFYFGSSSKLIGKLFTPGLRRSDLGVAQHFPGLTQLDLGPGIRGRSASDVARILGDNEAWKAAAAISLSGVGDDSTEGGKYRNSHFPFVGKTSLSARGVWVRRGNDDEGSFVVHEVLSCSHPFPFQRLRYRESDVCGDRDGDNAQQQARAKPKVPSKAELVDKDASTSLTPATYVISRRRKFPDLEKKPVFAQKPTAAPRLQGAEVAKGITPATKLVAVGDPLGSLEKIRSIDIVEAGDFLAWALSACQHLAGYHANVINASPDVILHKVDVDAEKHIVQFEGTSYAVREIAFIKLTSEANDESSLLTLIRSAEFVFPLRTRLHEPGDDNRLISESKRPTALRLDRDETIRVPYNGASAESKLLAWLESRRP